jgi:hypothetical protein
LATTIGVAFAVIANAEARTADDPRCNTPPYGGSVASYKAFVDTFNHLVTPTKMLSAICNMKFSGADRSALYNLGFTDSEIDSKDTSELAAQLVLALGNLVDKIK